MISYSIRPYRLKFRFPFRLAHTVREFTDNAYLILAKGRVEGIGEAVFPPYYPETPDTLFKLMQQVTLPNHMMETDMAMYTTRLAQQFPKYPFSRAALDMALHDLQSGLTGISIRQRYGIPSGNTNSSFTIGMSSDEEMKEKIAFGLEQGFTYFKLKVDQQEMERIIDTYKKCTDKPFVVDANQGFRDRYIALDWCQRLSADKVAYIEQPFHKDDYISHAWLKNHTDLPVIADESYQEHHQLTDILKSFDGINVKLMKSGGIYHAVNTLKEAKKLQLKTVIGCMADSSIGINAARQIAPLADWADLDGTYLITNDPYAQF